MSTQDITTRTGASPDGGNSDVEVKAAMDGFLQDFETFSVGLKGRIQEQDKRLTMIETKMTKANRPVLSAVAEVESPAGVG